MASVKLQLIFIVKCLVFFRSFEVRGDPLILTPYLKEGKIEEAQEKALVSPDMNGIKSYSGFFTVNKECGNNLFFWLVTAQKDWEEAPVLLWLNGGPGTTSLMGMFMEIGPFNYLKKKGFVSNKYHWTDKKNLLFLDQPVGAGFSFTENDCYAENLTAVAQDAYSALEQFFTLFPKLQKNDFFLTGQSHAGSYLPVIANEIENQRDNAAVKINLKGLLIVSPYIDQRCFKTGSYLYELGIIDENVLETVEKLEAKFVKAINSKNHTAAGLLDQQIVHEEYKYSYLPTFNNVLLEEDPSNEFQMYIRNYKVREQIHVGDAKFDFMSREAFDRLVGKLYEPSTKYLQQVLKTNKYIVGLFTGQLNAFGLYTSIPCMIDELEWDGTKEYNAVNRSQWYVEDRLTGWFKVGGNLFEAVVRDCGYYVPIDQPQAALDLIDAAVASKPGGKLLENLKTEGSSS